MNNTKQIDHPETQGRIADNIEALKAFKTGDTSLIEQYTGWGGLRDALYNRDVFCQLKFDCGLSDAEIASIKQTTSSGYFTPVEIVRQMWEMCEQYLPEPPKRILDPACGTAQFFAHMPEAWRNTAELVGVELDSLSAAMASARIGGTLVVPDNATLPTVPSSRVTILNTGFEHYHTPASFDCIVGNPAYGKNKIDDKQQPELMRYCIHHAFALKSFRLLKPGGLLCFLLPSWFLDNGSQHVRDIIAHENGQLIEAVRLPDCLFQNAKVTVDCVLIRKCAAGQNRHEWTQLGRIALGGRSERINRYFLDNPKQVLGRLASVAMYERYGLTCKYTQDPITLRQALATGNMRVSGAGGTQQTTGTQLVGAGKLDTLIAQIEGEIKKLQSQYRELTGLKVQQQTLEASINALQI